MTKMRRLLAWALAVALSVGSTPVEAQRPAEEPPAPSDAPAPGPIALFRTFARAQLAGAGFARRQRQIADQPFVWWEKGEGPPLVMIHGVADHAGTWFQLGSDYAAGRRLLLIDLPGHGESGPQEGPLPMSTVLAGLEAWLASEVVGEGRPPAELVGNSMGAWLALLVAHRHPEWLDRIVMVNGGPLRADTGELDLLPANREEARRLMAHLRDPASLAIPDPVLDDLVRRVDGGQVERMFEAQQDLESYLMADARLTEVTTPVELVWGVSDRYLGEAYPRRLLAGLPRARWTAVEACGHLPQAECPLRFAETLAAVLKREPPGGFRDHPAGKSTWFYSLGADVHDEVLCGTAGSVPGCGDSARFDPRSNARAQLDVGHGTAAIGLDFDLADWTVFNLLGGDADGVGHYRARSDTGAILVAMLTTSCTGTACCSGYGGPCGN